MVCLISDYRTPAPPQHILTDHLATNTLTRILINILPVVPPPSNPQSAARARASANKPPPISAAEAVTTPRDNDDNSDKLPP